MSDPLGWHVWPQCGLPATTFRPRKYHNFVPDEFFGVTDYYWSSHEADTLLPNGFVFLYLTPAHELGLLDIKNGERWRIPCPDTWEEALAWMRMTCELVQT